MRRCRICGAEAGGGSRCHKCKRAWIERRDWAFNKAQQEIGTLSAATHPAILKRIKQLEKRITVLDWQNEAKRIEISGEPILSTNPTERKEYDPPQEGE